MGTVRLKEQKACHSETSGKLGLVPGLLAATHIYWRTKVLWHEDRLLKIRARFCYNLDV